jgi:GNAT superfamily N-acetyltransferase
MFELRSMEPDDVEPCELVWDRAYRTMRERYHLPVVAREPAVAQMTQRRMAHLLATDPDGSVVATIEGRPVGFAQALVRENLWVLSLFGVEPSAQGNGIGRALLDASLVCGAGRPGMILVSRDPLAMRRYFFAGFDLHPTVAVYGDVHHDRLPRAPAVRAGTARDLEFVAGVDRAVRGASHGPHLQFLLQQEGRELLVHDGGGYAVAAGRPVLVAATSDAVATELLVAVLRRVPDGGHCEFGWLTARQQWAMKVALEAGLELHPAGPMGLRGFAAPPAAYIPTGAFA